MMAALPLAPSRLCATTVSIKTALMLSHRLVLTRLTYGRGKRRFTSNHRLSVVWPACEGGGMKMGSENKSTNLMLPINLKATTNRNESVSCSLISISLLTSHLLEVIDIPSNGVLLSIDDLVGHTPIAKVNLKAELFD